MRPWRQERKCYDVTAMCSCAKSIRNRVSWVIMIAKSTQPRVTQEEWNSPLRNWLDQTGCGHVCGALSWWLINVGGPSHLCILSIPRQVVLSFVKKKNTGWVYAVSRPVSSIIPWFLLEFPLQFHDGPWQGSGAQTNLSTWASYFILTTEKQIKTMRRV